jgi:hypothetical protein
MFQDENFKDATGETWKNALSKQLPQDCPTWEDKIKMCARWHTKGNCYDNCPPVRTVMYQRRIFLQKKSKFSHIIKKCREVAKKTSGWSLVVSDHQKNLPTRTFGSLLNSNFVLLPQPYNNTTNTNRRQEILISQHGSSIQHQHKSDDWEILTSCHGNSLQHQHQTHLAHGLS